ncbi:predicted protein [Plenodomus lingam JN3]|uniref:Predicted protein n=1 Tax=Leptosphaeria maculans (strain JN3 / isolate v23.1.3 / race Av1-4-5-6-7-8) TaxID=985895 RepID=E5R576_LEPMJ|nr:predicted protein [Plenodomus lingam JN3]CBX92046.1 predicted protein [Plenodomus lingam JN3]
MRRTGFKSYEILDLNERSVTIFHKTGGQQVLKEVAKIQRAFVACALEGV